MGTRHQIGDIPPNMKLTVSVICDGSKTKMSKKTVEIVLCPDLKQKQDAARAQDNERIQKIMEEIASVDKQVEEAVGLKFNELKELKQKKAEAQANEQAQANAQTQNVLQAGLQANAKAQVQAQEQAQAQARANANALARAQAQANAPTHNVLQARLQAQAHANAQAQAIALARARANANALAQAQAQANAQAHAIALARAQANAQTQATAQAQTQARIQAGLQAQAHANALAQASAQAQANAQAHANAQAQAHANALAQAQGEVQRRLQGNLQAEAHALARANAPTLDQLELQVQLQAQVRARAQANGLAPAQAPAENASEEAPVISLMGGRGRDRVEVIVLDDSDEEQPRAGYQQQLDALKSEVTLHKRRREAAEASLQTSEAELVELRAKCRRLENAAPNQGQATPAALKKQVQTSGHSTVGHFVDIKWTPENLKTMQSNEGVGGPNRRIMHSPSAYHLFDALVHVALKSRPMQKFDEMSTIEEKVDRDERISGPMSQSPMSIAAMHARSDDSVCFASTPCKVVRCRDF